MVLARSVLLLLLLLVLVLEVSLVSAFAPGTSTSRVPYTTTSTTTTPSSSINGSRRSSSGSHQPMAVPEENHHHHHEDPATSSCTARLGGVAVLPRIMAAAMISFSTLFGSLPTMDNSILQHHHDSVVPTPSGVLVANAAESKVLGELKGSGLVFKVRSLFLVLLLHLLLL